MGSQVKMSFIFFTSDFFPDLSIKFHFFSCNSTLGTDRTRCWKGQEAVRKVPWGLLPDLACTMAAQTSLIVSSIRVKWTLKCLG